MTARLLTAQPVVEKIKQDLIDRCQALKIRGITPSMRVFLVGNNPASLTYIKNKKRMCEEVGATFELHQLPDSTSAEEFKAEVEKLNQDPSVHGIIIQLPVSEKLKALNISNLVIPEKDIDGFHGVNTQNLYAGSTNLNLLLPCTPKGIVRLLQHYQIPIAGKHIVVIGRSLIVGKPLAMLLSNLNATVTIAHSKTQNLAAHTRQADIVISAVGKAQFLKASDFDVRQNTTVIDVGMNTLNGKLTGDVDSCAVAGVTSSITPVPGGVGPMTVITLIENLITACEQSQKGRT
jgi:methylenetetrahydrofolate dehydrogenase (NADP+) / methenyltetrahydrofolate cyclohydrolase